MDSSGSRRVFIYGLIDPRDSRIYYVGQSVWPGSRRCDHEKRARWCTRETHTRCVWLKSLHALGLRAALVILDAVDDESEWELAERAWIEYARWCKWPLTNLTSGGAGKTKLP